MSIMFCVSRNVFGSNGTPGLKLCFQKFLNGSNGATSGSEAMHEELVSNKRYRVLVRSNGEWLFSNRKPKHRFYEYTGTKKDNRRIIQAGTSVGNNFIKILSAVIRERVKLCRDMKRLIMSLKSYAMNSNGHQAKVWEDSWLNEP